MNNWNLKRIGLCLSLITLILILFPSNVEAKSGNSGGETCLNKVHVTWDPSNPLDIENSFGLEVTVDEGTWKVYAEHVNVDDPGELFNNNNKLRATVTDNWTTVTSSSPYKVTNKQLNRDGQYIVLFIKLSSTIKNDKGETICKPGYFYLKGNSIKITSVNGNANKIGEGTGMLRFIRFSKFDDDLATGTNSSKKSCELMRNGTYNNDGTASNKDIQGGFNNSDYTSKMKNYFPYCWTESDHSNIEFSNRTINAARKNFIDYYNTVSKLKFSTAAEINSYNATLTNLQSSTEWTEKQVSGKKESEWSTNAGSLECSSKLRKENTEKYWAKETVLDNDYCSVKCTEQFTTTYSPPVASRAGLCFTYQVTVKSKVTCITEQKNNIPWPQNKVSTCKYTAVCEHGSDQAGPSDDFDSCIQECDGGEYSQSCINKCYNKIYDNKSTSKTKNSTTTKTSAFENKAAVQFMADSKANKPYQYYEKEDGTYFSLKDNCQTKEKLLANLDMCAAGFKEAKDTKPLGSYTKNGKKYTWTPDFSVKTSGTYSIAGTNRTSGTNSVINSVKRAAPYYLRTISATKTLLKSFFGVDTGTNGVGTTRYYNIDENGIKRQVSNGWSCPESCWFKQSKNSAANCISTDEEAYDIYNNEISVKAKAVEACTTASTNLCSTTEATFNIGASNITKDETLEYTFTNSNKSGNAIDDIVCAQQSQSNLLNNIFAKLPEDNKANPKCDNGVNGVCYGTSYDGYQYKTTITFPGAWINLKTGEVKYENDQTLTNKGYELENYKYCTMYNSSTTNEKWWSWRVSSTDNNAVPKVEKYNINADVTSFGKFNWKLDFKCFYALSNRACVGSECDNEETCKDGCCDDNTCEGEPVTSPQNIDYRFIQEGEELFPNGRAAGFNWTSEATDKALRKELCGSDGVQCPAAKGYDIDPSEYAEEIKTTGESVYNETPEVHIQINGREDFNKIGSKVEQIAKFDGSIGNGYTQAKSSNGQTIDGLYYYTSSILKNLSIKKLELNYTKGSNYD